MNAIHVLTGMETDVMKVATMDLLDESLDIESVDPCQILIATDTAKCGISSSLL
jgi:hypothetical protein